MRTLIVEPDALRARNWALHFGNLCDHCDTAQSTGQARVMLVGEPYDRVCLHLRDAGTLLSVIRAVNPDCEVVDLGSRRVRLATGPITDRDVSTAGLCL